MSLNSNILNLNKIKGLNEPEYPVLPYIGYYDKSDTNNNNKVSYQRIKTNLSTACSAFTDSDGNTSKNPNSLYSPIQGSGKLGENEIYNNLLNGIPFKQTNADSSLVNQINFLGCQLAQARSRAYDSNDFNTAAGDISIKKIFDQFSNLKPYLVLIFIITIYLFVNGIFSSLDLVGNIFAIIEKNSSMSLEYWIGLLIGLAIPIIVLCSLFVGMVCETIGETEKYMIRDLSGEKKCTESFDNPTSTPSSYTTTQSRIPPSTTPPRNPNATDQSDPTGKLTSIEAVVKNLDASIIALFIFIIYCFVAVLFTVKRSQVGNFLYTIFTSVILFILAIFFYLLYAYIPFFSTGNNTPTPKLQLFVDTEKNSKDRSDDASNISTNQQRTSKIKQVFMITSLVVVVLSILFFMKGSSPKSSWSIINFFNDFFDGFLGSAAILVVPIIWVFNFVLAIRYFYFYPIILIGIRFIRYVGMLLLYFASNMPEFVRIKEGFSEDLTELLDKFENYNPSWSLIGVGLFKTLLSIMGFENIFSKDILGNDETSKNISNNKFISAGMFRFFKDIFDNPNYKGIALFVFMAILTVIVSVTILYGVVQI
jgi:hypothetical protein